MKKAKSLKIGRISDNPVRNTANPTLDSNGKAVKTGTVSAQVVANLIASSKRGHVITNYKSRNFSTGSIVARKLVSADPEVMQMYKELLVLAGMAK